MSNGIGKDQKQAQEKCPSKSAKIDKLVIIVESDLPDYQGVKWKLISFSKDDDTGDRRIVQFTQYPGSDKWIHGQCWIQGQYTKDKCAVSGGQCLCRQEIFPRNSEDWTLEEDPCKVDWPPGEISIGTQLTAAPPGFDPIALTVTYVSKLDKYGQHPDGCPKKATMGTGESNDKKFSFLWKDGDLIVLSPGFICDEGHHMVNSILEGSSKMCNDAGENCRFGFVDAAKVTCNGDTKAWENFPTCVPN
jgi:hypothetical protein